MAIQWRNLINTDQDPNSGPFSTTGHKLANVANADQVDASTANNGMIYYDSDDDQLHAIIGGARTTIGSAGSGDNTLDQAYDQGGAGSGRTITVDSGAVALTVPDTSNNGVLNLTQNDSTNNPVVLTLSNAGSGNDVTADNWSVTKAGAGAFVGLTTTAALTLGSDGSGVDVTFNSGTAGDLMLWDASERTLLLTDSEIHLGDNDRLNLGTGSATGTGDFELYSDGTDLIISANADVLGQTFRIGDDTNDIDLLWEGDTNGSTVLFDASADSVVYTTVTHRMNDDANIAFGTGSDFTMGYNSGNTNLEILAGADIAGQALIIGDATNDMDIQWTGNTASDTVLFDSSADQVTFTDIQLSITESDDNNAVLMSGAATGADVVIVRGTGALTDNNAVLAVESNAAVAAGGNVLRIEDTGGSKNADSRLAELEAVGTDMRGIFADVDAATNPAYAFNCGGATAASTSSFLVSHDGDPAAASAAIFGVSYTGTATNNPILGAYSGSGLNVTGLSVTCDADGSAASHLNITDSKDGALGVVVQTHQDSASPTASDVVYRHSMDGEDDGSARTTYARVEGRILLATGGQEDGQYVVEVATNDGTLRQGLLVGPQTNSAETLIEIGTGSGAGVVQSSGNFDLTIQTGNSTTGDITLTDGANGNITITPNGSGQIDLANAVLHSKTQSVGSGDEAIDVVSNITEITSDADGTAHSLADGTEGQVKFICLITYGGGDGVVTPTNFTGGSTITFNDAGDAVWMLFTNGSWFVVGNNGATIA